MMQRMMMPRMMMPRMMADRYYKSCFRPSVDVRINLIGIESGVNINITAISVPDDYRDDYRDDMGSREVSVSCQVIPYKRIDILV